MFLASFPYSSVLLVRAEGQQAFLAYFSELQVAEAPVGSERPDSENGCVAAGPSHAPSPFPEGNCWQKNKI